MNYNSKIKKDTNKYNGILMACIIVCVNTCRYSCSTNSKSLTSKCTSYKNDIMKNPIGE